ncbi:MAG: sugar transferase [Solirubrobacteraceae bacterium]
MPNGDWTQAVARATAAVVTDPASRSAARSGSQRDAATRRRHREWLLRRLLAGSDCVALLAALALAGLLMGRRDLVALLGLAAVAMPGWLLLIRSYGLYDRDPKRINCSTVDDIPGIFHGVFIGSVLLWGYFRLLPVASFGFAELILFGALAVVLLLGARALVRNLVRRRWERHAVIVGEGPTTGLLARKLAAHPEYGVRLIGALRTAGSPDRDAPGTAEQLPVLGSAVELEQLTAGCEIDRVIVAADGIEERELIELLRRCKRIGLRVSVLPQSFDVIGSSVEIDDVEGVTLLGLNPPLLSRSARALKRAMDLAGSVACLLLTAPLLVAIAIAIKLDSPGPVLFAQTRVGRGGARIKLWKFRTMIRDAERQRQRLLARSEDPHWLKLSADPRITKVGRWLRLTSLDELPQLFNVIKGEMSLVGPRPLIEAEAEHVQGWGLARLDLTPGITGLWQVLGRTTIPFGEMVKLDYLYVTNWSLWSDVRLLLRTLPAIVTRRGAN